ncbi:hypothetical protein ACFX11_028388 [Malus domestica]
MGVLVIATLGVGLQTHKGVCGWEIDFWEWKSHPVISGNGSVISVFPHLTSFRLSFFQLSVSLNPPHLPLLRKTQRLRGPSLHPNSPFRRRRLREHHRSDFWIDFLATSFTVLGAMAIPPIGRSLPSRYVIITNTF